MTARVKWNYRVAEPSSFYSCSQETLDKAIWILDKLLPLLESHGVALAKDSEQGIIALELGNGLELLIEPESDRQPCIVCYGRLVGTLCLLGATIDCERGEEQ